MVDLLAIAVLAVVLALLFGVYRIIKAVKPLIINAIIGLIVLLLAGTLGFGVEITPIVVLIVAFGGLPAAILVIILAQIGIIFTPALLLFT